MKLAVLSSPESWYLRDLQRAAGDRHQLTAVPFTRLRSEVGEDQTRIASGGQDLRSFDAVLVRSMPPGSLEQVVFRMDALHQLQSAGTMVINPPRAIEVAVDKYLALARLQAAGLAVPRTAACQTVEEALAHFADFGHDAVIKPLFGSEGRGITRINDAALAPRIFGLLVQLGAVIYLQEYVPHQGHDIRLLVIGDDVLAIRRCNPLDWRTNISRGARAEPFQTDTETVGLALRAARAVGAVLAGVDLLPSRDGRLLVLEVNAVPGWQAVARTLNVDVAQTVLRQLASMACNPSALGAECSPT